MREFEACLMFIRHTRRRMGWRDFLRFTFATIVIGLLIAIGLEQTVEWVHHREIVRTARENIGAEIKAERCQLRWTTSAFLREDADAHEAQRRTGTSLPD